MEKVMRNKKHSLAELHAAEDARHAIGPDASDENIAAAEADWLTARTHQPPYHLGINHDVRPSAAKKAEMLRKIYPDRPFDPTGPCPLEYVWQRHNTVGIKTLDRERARAWAREALLLGYRVFVVPSNWHSSLQEARERARRAGGAS
jgi:hypothetical protein